jgi:hypothetical protein
MISFTSFVRDLFCLANIQLAAGEAGDGHAFEARIARHLAAVGIRPVEVFSGVKSMGSQSLSGLYHQIDASGAIHEAIVIGEWKTYRGSIPKNELLRFKAATDDYWLRQYPYAAAPVMRVFGGTGHVSTELRRYAAHWGICLITADRWPVPILASESTMWHHQGPDRLARRYLAWLSRPLNTVCAPHPDGSWSIPRLPAEPAIDHFLRLHDHWSGELWRTMNRRPGGIDAWIRQTIRRGVAA